MKANELKTEDPCSRRRQLLGLGLSAVAAFGLAACGGGGSGGSGALPAPIAGTPGPGGAPAPGGSPPAANDPVAAPPPEAPAPAAKSAKRGVAYDLADPADLAVLAPGVSWWYDWGLRPHASVPTDFRTRYGMDFLPMLWNGNFDSAEVESYLLAHPDIKHLLLLNEPNLSDQANLTP